MTEESSTVRTGVAAVVITWVIVGFFLAVEKRWDVIVAMLVSYAIGGATTSIFGDAPKKASAPDEGSAEDDLEAP